MKRIIIFIIVFILHNIGSPDELKYKNSIFFYFHDNIEFAYQRYFNPASGLKLNILFSGRSSDIETTADVENIQPYRDTIRGIINATGGETNEYLETSLQYMQMIYNIPSFDIYIGMGPLFRYGNYEISDRNEYEDLDTSTDYVYTKEKIKYFQLGLIGSAYIDYLLTERIGVFGEYKISCSYSWLNKIEENTSKRIDGKQYSIIYDVDSNSWSYKTYIVKFGLFIKL